MNIFHLIPQKQTLKHLHEIRQTEISNLIPYFPDGSKILEIGSGTGWQANFLESLGFEVCAVDLKDSNYAESSVREIDYYDGVNLPYSNKSFDIVFSSNVLEHIKEIEDFQHEIMRVLTTDGFCLHALPSSSWRFWTTITAFIRKDAPKVHGEIAKHHFTEIYYFSKLFWKKFFKKSGWKIEFYKPNNLFYTGHSILDQKLPIRYRKYLSFLFGSACNIYKLRKF
jgi:2-polyprenyl-3-methyl-5-hydroxy-6-metoxy-1,4-benzoquinol methylase